MKFQSILIGFSKDSARNPLLQRGSSHLETKLEREASIMSSHLGELWFHFDKRYDELLEKVGGAASLYLNLEKSGLGTLNVIYSDCSEDSVFSFNSHRQACKKFRDLLYGG